MLEKITEFFAGIWDSLIAFLLWLPVKIFTLFLDGIASVLETIPSPDFIANNSLGNYIDPDILWLLSNSGINAALAVIASAYVFKFFRRVLTLGIW